MVKNDVKSEKLEWLLVELRGSPVLWGFLEDVMDFVLDFVE